MTQKDASQQTWADPKTCQHHCGLVEGYCIDCRSTVLLTPRLVPARSQRIGVIPWIGSASNQSRPADNK
jgi:hypothetical protein